MWLVIPLTSALAKDIYRSDQADGSVQFADYPKDESFQLFDLSVFTVHPRTVANQLK